MLQKMRQQSQSAIILLLFGFIIFVFIFSFGAGSSGFRSGGCGRSGEAARVNGESISEMLFQFHYDQQLRMALSRRDRKQSLREEDKLQLRQQVLNTLVDQVLLMQAARRLGLHVTDEERNQSIREAPQFQDDGRFNFRLYKMIVQRHYQTTMAVFEEVWREQMLAQRMAKLVQDTARLVEDEVRHAFITRNTKVDLRFVKIPAQAYRTTVTPGDEEVQAFLDEHRDRVKEAYNQQHDRFHKPKQVQVSHVFYVVRKEYDSEQVKDKRDQAELTLDDLEEGADFAKQAKDYSEDDKTKDKGGTLAMMTRDELEAAWGTPFAAAAFALEPGELSKVVRSEKGFHVIRCEKVIAAEDHPLEEVEAELARELLVEERARQKAEAEAKRLLAGLQDGKKLAELVPETDPDETDQEKSTDRGPTLEVQSTGAFARMGGFIPKIGMSPELANAAFELSADVPVPARVFEVDSPVGLPSYVVVELAERQDPDMDEFEKKKDTLRRQLLMRRQQSQLAAWLQQQRDSASIETNPAFIQDTRPPGLRGQRRGP